jgi:hypothetical protein
LHRARLVLSTRPLAYWALALTVGTVTLLAVNGTVRAADARRAAWGESGRVVVATRSVVPGESLGPSNTRTERRPLAVLPEGALTALPQPAVASAGIAAGEVVVAARLAGRGRAPAGLLPAGTRGVAVPVGGTGLPLAVGDTVDVFAPLAGPGATPERVAARAVVVHVTEEAVVVAVPDDRATVVAGALADGAVVLALAP